MTIRARRNRFRKKLRQLRNCLAWVVVLVKMPQRIYWRRIGASKNLGVCMRRAEYRLSRIFIIGGAHSTLHSDGISRPYGIARLYKLFLGMQDFDVVSGAPARDRIRFMNHYMSVVPSYRSNFSMNGRSDWACHSLTAILIKSTVWT
jgi:hypothetical protein